MKPILCEEMVFGMGEMFITFCFSQEVRLYVEYVVNFDVGPLAVPRVKHGPEACMYKDCMYKVSETHW